MVPNSGETYLVLIVYLSVSEESGGSHLGLAVITTFELPPFTESSDYALASLTSI